MLISEDYLRKIIVSVLKENSNIVPLSAEEAGIDIDDPEKEEELGEILLNVSMGKLESELAKGMKNYIETGEVGNVESIYNYKNAEVYPVLRAATGGAVYGGSAILLSKALETLAPQLARATGPVTTVAAQPWFLKVTLGLASLGGGLLLGTMGDQALQIDTEDFRNDIVRRAAQKAKAIAEEPETLPYINIGHELYDELIKKPVTAFVLDPGRYFQPSVYEIKKYSDWKPLVPAEMDVKFNRILTVAHAMTMLAYGRTDLSKGDFSPELIEDLKLPDFVKIYADAVYNELIDLDKFNYRGQLLVKLLLNELVKVESRDFMY